MSDIDKNVEQISNVNDGKKAGSFDIKEFLQKNGMYILGGLVGVALIIGGVFYYNDHQSKKEAEASLALNRIQPYFDRGDYQVALSGDSSKKMRGADIIGLRAIADEYSGTSTGKTAALLAGKSLFLLKKIDEAEQYFTTATKSKSDIVALGGEAGLAACYEEKKQYDKAAEQYEKIIPVADKINSKGKYLYFAGLCYEQLGNKEKAEKCYRDIIGEIDNQEFSGEAKSALTRLGMVVE